MSCPMGSCNTGVGGKDHGNREIKEYCYQASFFDEDGGYICTEPFTVSAYDADQALCVVDQAVQDHCLEFGYEEADITLEDVC